MTHEFGHWLDANVPGVGDATQEFLKYRFGNEWPTPINDVARREWGEALFQRQKAIGNIYDSWEKGRKDAFDRIWGDTTRAYYPGKVYENIPVYGWRSTEVISSGAPALHTDALKFFALDPEYAKFTMGVLHGPLRGGKR
jgi:hypothetical protein